MCRKRPCRCSARMFRINDTSDFWDTNGAPRVGAFMIVTVQDGPNHYQQLEVVLPCEGGELHGLPIAPAIVGHWNKAQWQLLGTADAPTLSPSVLTGERDHKLPHRPIIREHWHGWITNGHLKSC